MSEQQMQRAGTNLRSAENRLAQLNKQRAQALARLNSSKERGVAPACLLAVYEKNVSDVARRIEAAEAQADMFRTKVYQIKQQRAASKAMKKMVKQQSIAKDGEDGGEDLIRAVHSAIPATAADKVVRCQAAEPVSAGGVLWDMAVAGGFFVGVGGVMILGTAGFITKKLRLW